MLSHSVVLQKKVKETLCSVLGGGSSELLCEFGLYFT